MAEEHIIKLPKKLDDIADWGTPVPGGTWPLKITKCEVKQGPSGQMVVANYKVVMPGSPFDGSSPFNDQLSLVEAALPKLKGWLKALGVPGDRKEVPCSKLVDKMVIAVTNIEMFNNTPRNKYTSYLKYDKDIVAEVCGVGKGVGNDAGGSTAAGGDGKPSAGGDEKASAQLDDF